MVGQRVGGVCDVREDWRVVDQRSGGGDHTAGSVKDGGLGISRPLAVITVRVTIVASVSPVSVSSVSVISIVSISLGLGISRSLAVVTKVSKSMIAKSDRVSGHFMLNLGGTVDHRLDNWRMSNSPNSGPNIWNSGSSVGQTSTIQELWVSLSGSEGEQSGSQEKFDHDAGREESKRATERAELAEGKLKDVETELETIGENMKQLEISAEKATEREEKLKDKILNLMERFKVAEARYEYGESNITKLNHRTDDIEDEIYREKLKIKKFSDELNDPFDDMLANY